jgi:hypothetical protein
MALFARAQGWREPPRVGPVDRLLHAERLDGRRQKRVSRHAFADLPDGTFVREGGVQKLLIGGRLYAWSPAGYGPPEMPPGGTAEVLTPPAIIAVLRAGYRPVIHPTCRSLQQS